MANIYQSLKFFWICHGSCLHRAELQVCCDQSEVRTFTQTVRHHRRYGVAGNRVMFLLSLWTSNLVETWSVLDCPQEKIKRYGQHSGP